MDEKNYKALILNQARTMYNNSVKTKKNLIRRHNYHIKGLMKIYTVVSIFLITLIFISYIFNNFFGVIIDSWLLIVFTTYYFWSLYKSPQASEIAIKKMDIYIKKNKDFLESAKDNV